MKITEKDAEKIFSERQLKKEDKITDAPRMVLHTEIDTTPQKLRKLRSFTSMLHRIPSMLPEPARVVIHLLCLCFDKQKSVQEGLVGDILWGFSQEHTALPGMKRDIKIKITYDGLNILEKLGYIKLQAPDGTFVQLDSTKAENAWVRYQKPLLDIIYQDMK